MGGGQGPREISAGGVLNGVVIGSSLGFLAGALELAFLKAPSASEPFVYKKAFNVVKRPTLLFGCVFGAFLGTELVLDTMQGAHTTESVVASSAVAGLVTGVMRKNTGAGMAAAGGLMLIMGAYDYMGNTIIADKQKMKLNSGLIPKFDEEWADKPRTGPSTYIKPLPKKAFL